MLELEETLVDLRGGRFRFSCFTWGWKRKILGRGHRSWRKSSGCLNDSSWVWEGLQEKSLPHSGRTRTQIRSTHVKARRERQLSCTSSPEKAETGDSWNKLASQSQSQSQSQKWKQDVAGTWICRVVRGHLPVSFAH